MRKEILSFNPPLSFKVPVTEETVERALKERSTFYVELGRPALDHLPGDREKMRRYASVDPSRICLKLDNLHFVDGVLTAEVSRVGPLANALTDNEAIRFHPRVLETPFSDEKEALITFDAIEMDGRIDLSRLDEVREITALLKKKAGNKELSYSILEYSPNDIPELTPIDNVRYVDEGEFFTQNFLVDCRDDVHYVVTTDKPHRELTPSIAIFFADTCEVYVDPAGAVYDKRDWSVRGSKGIKEWDKCMALMDEYGYSEDEKRKLSDVLEEQEDSGKVMMAFILKMDRAQQIGKADESGVKSCIDLLSKLSG